MPVSSKQITRCLERRGFQESKGTGDRGSHRTYFLRQDGAPTRTVTVVIGEREIPRGTLRNMAGQLGIDLDEFTRWIEGA